MFKILLVDDSMDMLELIKHCLSPYFVKHATTIAMAEKDIAEIEYDLFLIDVMLPDGNGFDLCTRLSHDPRSERIPRILLTGMIETSEKVYGFNCGADDYVTKPFNGVELKARVDRCLRRTGSNDGVFNHSVFEFNSEFQKCYLLEPEKRDLGLTPTEFRVFLNLVKSEGRVLSRKLLEKAAWEAHGTVIEARGIDTHIAHIRKKLGALKGVIVSVYGQGYSFKAPQASAKAA